jgi:hypothetical protein
MEIVGSGMNPGQIKEELSWFVAFLREQGCEDLVVQYGWGCKLPTDELWVDQDVRTGDMLDFIDKAEAGGVYIAGASDIFLSDRLKIFSVQLCHESDIHVTSERSAITGPVLERWRDCGYQAWVRV